MLVNSWHGTGNAGRDAELNYTPNGHAVAKFSIAVHLGKDRSSMWLNIVCWGKLAERVVEKIKKGQEVYVEGRLEVRQYTDKSGQDRQSVEIIANTAQPTQRLDKSAAPTDTYSPSFDPDGELDDHPF